MLWLEWNRRGRLWFFNGKLLRAVMIHHATADRSRLPSLQTTRETVSLDELVRVARVYTLKTVAY